MDNTKGTKPYHTLGFCLFRKCNACCEICCFDSDISCPEELSVDRVKEYILESKKIPYLETIAFTGGEPFLAYEMVLDLVYFAHKCGKRVTLITNGFWATNMEITTSKLKSLKEFGLNHLSISFDTYHLQYIPILNIKNILKVAQKIELPITLSMVKIKNEEIGFLLDKLEGELYGVPFEIVPCLPAGRANKYFNDDDFDKRLHSSDKGLRCYYAGNLVVGYDGYIYPCCSQMSMSTGLQIGNFNEISLKDALYKAKNNSLLYLIRNMDMSVFVEYAKTKQINLPDFVVHQCELCPYLFSKENLTIYKELVKSEIQKIKHSL